MDKLTAFINELLTNKDKLELFNVGSNEAEVINNRQTMLNAAGVKHAEKLAGMNAQELQALTEKEVALLVQEHLETTICGLIAKQKLEHPERIAIIDGETSIDYRTLLKRANEVAGELKSREVAPGSLVGVCMNRSWELVATLLGVMQAGCAYVPLDPTYPQERIHYMLEHSQAAAAIVDHESAANLCNGIRELVWMHEVGKHVDHSIQASANDLAYA